MQETVTLLLSSVEVKSYEFELITYGITPTQNVTDIHLPILLSLNVQSRVAVRLEMRTHERLWAITSPVHLKTLSNCHVSIIECSCLKGMCLDD